MPSFMDIVIEKKKHAGGSVQFNQDTRPGEDDIEISKPTRGTSGPRFARPEADDFDDFVNEAKEYMPSERDEHRRAPQFSSGFDASDQEDDNGPGPWSRGGDYDENDGYTDEEDPYEQETGGEQGSRHHSSYANEMEEKIDLLSKIGRFQSRGFQVKPLDVRSQMDDIRVEYRRLKKEVEVATSLKFSREALMVCVTGIEFLNNRYDPFRLKLDGWSEHTMETIHDYDNVFEKLHDKYHDYVQMSPELELLLMFGGSAFMFHLTQTMMSSSSALKGAMNGNPELMQGIVKAMANMGGGPPPPEDARNAPPPNPGSKPPPRDMPGPSIDLSGFPSMPAMSNSAPVSQLREDLPPPSGSEPPPRPEKTRKPTIPEDDLADLDSLGGSDLEQDNLESVLEDPPAPAKETKPKKKTTKPKARTRSVKTTKPEENVIDI